MIWPILPREDRLDLYTESKNLDNLLLSDCPIKFFENQRIMKDLSNGILYKFTDFPKDELLKYLDSINGKIGNSSYILTLSGSEEHVIRFRASNGLIINK